MARMIDLNAEYKHCRESNFVFLQTMRCAESSPCYLLDTCWDSQTRASICGRNCFARSRSIDRLAIGICSTKVVGGLSRI